MFLFRSIRTPVNTPTQGQHTHADQAPQLDDVPADMAERPRLRTSESTGSLPHVADLMVKPGRKVSGLRSAFERSNNKRIPLSIPPRGRPQSPIKRQDSIPEAEIPSYEAEIARLREKLEKERSVRREAQATAIRLEKEVETLKSDLERKDSFWREELRAKVHDARQEGRRPRDMHSSRSQARLGDNGLQRQLTELKRSISRSTRVESVATSDATFVQEMGSLAHEIQNWTVNSYRRARISASAEELTAKLVPLVNDRQLERLEPVWAGWRSENKIAILQSTVAAILMDIFDDQLLFGMPPHEKWAISLRKTAHHISTVLEAQQYDKWRACSLELVRQTTVMNKAVDSAASTMAEYVTTTLDTLSGQASSAAKLASLQPIVKRAITLAHLFRIQRARFTFDFPAPSTSFDPSFMENVAFDRDAEEGHPIDCATFPLVLKLGDEHGANIEWQNVLLKANVVCGET
ncbi:hypothetical protein Q7P35_005827 [Cladosporium inversicolor]